jgi:hypothetical protein
MSTCHVVVGCAQIRLLHSSVLAGSKLTAADGILIYYAPAAALSIDTDSHMSHATLQSPTRCHYGKDPK